MARAVIRARMAAAVAVLEHDDRRRIRGYRVVAGAVPAGTQPWSGAGSAIKLTAQQNVFLATDGFGAVSPFHFVSRRGWYLAPPNYNTPVLLEDLAPPICLINVSSTGLVTVTTCIPHGILSPIGTTQPGDWIELTGVTPSSINSTTQIQVNVTSPTTFTYTCTGCPIGTISNPGGFATKFIYWLYRTVEMTDPNTGITYLYNGNEKIVEPTFLTWTSSGEMSVPTALSTNSPLAGFSSSVGNLYLLYENSSGHMEVLAYTNGNWQATDLSLANGTAPPASQIIQPGPGSFYYFDGNAQLNGIYVNSGGTWTGSGELAAPPHPGPAARWLGLRTRRTILISCTPTPVITWRY